LPVKPFEYGTKVRYLVRAQVASLKSQTDGHPALNQMVQIEPGGNFAWHLPMRENGVFLVSLTRLQGDQAPGKI
jgi:hypothetical protein